MFSGLFARPNPRLAALEAARKLYVAQVNGYAGDTAEAVIAAELHVWNRILTAFQIDPSRGVEANLARIGVLMENCRGMADRFDFAGLVVPTLIHNSGFAAEDIGMLQQHLTGTAPQSKSARRSPALTEQAGRPVAAFAA
ncbi:hypothetical protein [Fuscibacter oryzae]|uniref:Uncharacterized protein n=1 Tax=Fuscibacter oryzae TaxID=2803939 RepID=A0A8J7SSQ3_9RHOB|nr:hypothetical protein [Fuscibacter oryzae]MBL4928551.1 hypothetical protein [Fuscibacter oryzae]